MHRACVSYLSRLEALNKPDGQLAGLVIDGLLQLIEFDDVLFVTALPIAGLRTNADKLEFEGVTLRRLTNKEIGSLIEDIGSICEPARPWRRSMNWSITMPWFKLHNERHMLIVKKRCSKTARLGSHRGPAVVLALQLLGFEPRGTGRAASYTEPGPSLWSGGLVISLADYGEGIRDFTEADLEDAVQLARQVPDEVFTGPKIPRGIALHRFRSAVCEPSPVDALIDYTIALEALLLPGMKEEASFRLALYGARYLEADLAERQQVFKELRTLYKTRSGFVHGTEPLTDVEKFEALRKTARDLSGRLLVKALRQGWPTMEQFKHLALS
jgi:hypothetical protein